MRCASSSSRATPTSLASLLDRLDGRVQMSVKAYYVGEALLREVLLRYPELKRRSDAIEQRSPQASHPERIALGRDVAAAVEEQRELDERLLLRRCQSRPTMCVWSRRHRIGRR